MIKMHRTDDLKAPGDFEYLEHGFEPVKGLLRFVCPNGHKCTVATLRGNFRDGTPPRWGFGGNIDAPTLTPSINCNGKGGCGWHGHITKGEMLP